MMVIKKGRPWDLIYVIVISFCRDNGNSIAKSVSDLIDMVG